MKKPRLRDEATDAHSRAVERASRGATFEELVAAGLIDLTCAPVEVSPSRRFPDRPDAHPATTAELIAAGLR